MNMVFKISLPSHPLIWFGNQTMTAAVPGGPTGCSIWLDQKTKMAAESALRRIAKHEVCFDFLGWLMVAVRLAVVGADSWVGLTRAWKNGLMGRL